MATPDTDLLAVTDDARRHRLRFQQLASVAAELAAADTVVEVVDLITRRVSDVVTAAVAAVLLRDGDFLVVAGDTGISNPAKWRRFPVTLRTPVTQAVVENRLVLVPWSAEMDAVYPDLDGRVAPGRTLVCLPMTAERRSIGALSLSFDPGTLPEPEELDFLVTYADSSAQAIRRIQATEAAGRRARRLDFLAGASEQLASDLDYRTTLQKVAELAVPDLADWCTVTLNEDGKLHTVAVAHTDPAKVEWAWRLQDVYPPDIDAPAGVAHVIRTGSSELFGEITDEMIAAAARDEEHLQVVRDLGMHSAITVPLAARGHVFGAITLIRSDTPAAYGNEELAVAQDLARRAGLALDNASLYTQTRDVALQLQRAVLPEALDTVPGWRIANLYRPGHQAEVGGDFYDAVALDDGRVAVFIGDVMGHGVAAAAAMAAMRSAVRAYLSIDPTPSVVAAKLDRMFAQLHIPQLVTLVYGVLDEPASPSSTPGTTRRWSSRPTARPGRWRPRRRARSGPAASGVPTAEAAIRAGDTVLLFTDGLVERRGEIIDVGIGRLMERADALGRGRPGRGAAASGGGLRRQSG